MSSILTPVIFFRLFQHGREGCFGHHRLRQRAAGKTERYRGVQAGAAEHGGEGDGGPGPGPAPQAAGGGGRGGLGRRLRDNEGVQSMS